MITLIKYCYWFSIGFLIEIGQHTHDNAPAGNYAAYRAKTEINYLMIDPAIAEKSVNTTIHKIRPSVFKRAVVPDKPWEGNDVSFAQVFPNKEGGYNMYYFSMDHGGRRFVNIATSQDGITWNKPALGIIAYNGNRNTNIVIPDIFEFGDVFRYPNNSSGQYYMLLMMKDYRHYYFTSADGRTFTQNKQPVMEFCADTQNQVFFDPNKKNYMFFFRSFIHNSTNNEYYRTVSKYETSDPRKISIKKKGAGMKRWGAALPPAFNNEIPRVMYLDYSRKENLDKDIYTPAVIPRKQHYLAFPSMYYHFDATRSKLENDGILNLNLFYSKDAREWHNYGTYIDTSQLPGFHRIYMGSGVINKKNLTYHYLAAEKSTHGQYTTYSCVFRTEFEKDRYAALRSGDKQAVTTLPPAEIAFTKISLNFKTLRPSGYVRVQILDERGRLVGTSKKMTGNELEKSIIWAPTSRSSFQKGAIIQIIHTFSDIYTINYK